MSMHTDRHLRLVARDGKLIPGVELPPLQPYSLARFVVSFTLQTESYNSWVQLVESMRNMLLGQVGVSRGPTDDIDRGLPSRRLIVADQSNLTEPDRRLLQRTFTPQGLRNTLRHPFTYHFPQSFSIRPSAMYYESHDENQGLWGILFTRTQADVAAVWAQEMLAKLANAVALPTDPHMILGTVRGSDADIIAALRQTYEDMEKRKAVSKLTFGSPEVTEVL